MIPIQTKDRLPEDRQHVLFYRYAWMLGMFYDEDKFFCERGGICHSQRMISHWMLLPGDPNKTGCALEQTTLVCSQCLEERNECANCGHNEELHATGKCEECLCNDFVVVGKQ